MEFVPGVITILYLFVVHLLVTVNFFEKYTLSRLDAYSNKELIC